MIHLNKNIITKQEADDFIEHYQKQNYLFKDYNNWVVDRILNIIEPNLNFILSILFLVFNKKQPDTTHIMIQEVKNIWSGVDILLLYY